MNSNMITRRKFLVASATAVAGLALTGCAGASSQAVSSSASAAASASHQDTSSTSQIGQQGASSTPGSSSPASSSEQAAASSAEGTAAGTKTLVACFSATGHTKAIAEKIVEHLGADYFEIEASEPYTEDDLNYNDETTRATAEQNMPNARPGLAAFPDFSSYDVVYLGHPIWWGKAPRLMCTLLEGSDLSGKKVAEFCTSGSSGIEGASSELEGLAPGAEWVGAQRFAAGASESDVAAWTDSLGV